MLVGVSRYERFSWRRRLASHIGCKFDNVFSRVQQNTLVARAIACATEEFRPTRVSHHNLSLDNKQQQGFIRYVVVCCSSDVDLEIATAVPSFVPSRSGEAATALGISKGPTVCRIIKARYASKHQRKEMRPLDSTSRCHSVSRAGPTPTWL